MNLDSTFDVADAVALLEEGTFRLHPAALACTLHGSRGPQGSARPDSDIDLCIFAEGDQDPEEILGATREAWTGSVRLDVACILVADADVAAAFLAAAAGPMDSGLLVPERLVLYKPEYGRVDPRTLDPEKMVPFAVLFARGRED